jgi:type IV pilus assembly protein PilM
MLLARRRFSPIGVDVGLESVKLVQVVREGDETEVSALARHRFPEPHRSHAQADEDAVEAVRSLRRASRFHGREAVACLSGDQVLVRHVRLPRDQAGDLTAAVRREVEEHLPELLRQATVRFIVAGETSERGEAMVEVIVVAAAEEVVQSKVRMLRRMHLVPVGLDLDTCALHRCFVRPSRRASERTDVAAFVDVGHGGTRVVISGDGRPVFIKTLARGGADFDRTALQETGLREEQLEALRRASAARGDASEAEAEQWERLLQEDALSATLFRSLRTQFTQLASEVLNCLRYFHGTFPGIKVGRLTLTGGAAATVGLRRVLMERTGVPVALGNPLRALGVREGVDVGPFPAVWGVGLGLAFKELVG